jgi:UDP-N-acetylmuramyl pentapeptide phosphotransferase/UDP-N-acetylglucosamine-1-phosphate transferase
MSEQSGRGPDEQHLRKEARRRLQAKQQAKQTAVVFLLISVVLIAIWALSGMGYFWPAWPIAGMGIGLGFIFYNAYGGGGSGPSEADVDEEMRRMQGGH